MLGACLFVVFEKNHPLEDMRARGELNIECEPGGKVIAWPALEQELNFRKNRIQKLTHQVFENFVAANPGAYSRTKAGEDKNEEDPEESILPPPPK